MSSLKKFAGQTALYGVSTVLPRVISFLLTTVYVRIYPAGVYGIFTKLYSYASLLNAVLAFGMETTFFRYLNKHEDKKDQVIATTFFTISAIAVVFLSLSLFFSAEIASWIHKGNSASIGDYVKYVRYFIYVLVADALAVIPFSMIRAEGKPARYGMVKTINILTFIAFNLVFIFAIPAIIRHNWAGAAYLSGWFRYQWVGYVFVSNLIASIVTLVLLLPEIRRIPLAFSKTLAANMFLYSFPVLVANISFIINENADKIFLDKLLPSAISEQQTGIYGACAKIAVFLSLFITAFRLGAEPFFFSHAKNSNARETYARIMNYFVIAVCIICVAITVNIEIFKGFIKGGTPEQKALYWSGLPVVPVLLFGYICLGIYMNLSIWYKLSDQTRFGLYISGIGAVLTVILNLIFIPKYSYIAAAWVSFIAYATMMVLSYLMGRKNYPIPYNIRKNLSYFLAAALLAWLSFSIFRRNILVGNFLLLLYIAGTWFFEKEELKKIWKTL